ncbi:MAG: isovaleryl-CoA dehydrogenase [Hyphomicrobiaceae bacterium]
MTASFVTHLETHDVVNQSPPFAEVNFYALDRPLRDAVARGGAGAAEARLTALGGRAGSAEMLDHGRLANENPPKLRTFDPKGRRLDVVEFHPSYHACMRLSFAEGLHCSPWDHLVSGGPPAAGAHVARSAGIYMMAQTEAGHGCPITMTFASVPALRLQPDLTRDWIGKITSRAYDPLFRPLAEKASATVGMGMTEKQGGTDVRANTTHAQPVAGVGPGREYLITGHKWFMSAPMCDAFLVLAQAQGGLSCFLMPRFLPDGTVNALRFQRLKDKLGNRSNASSEVEFEQAHGWLIGEEGRGVNSIIEMVTCTRLDCAVASAGHMRFALANAIHHTRHRTAFQKKLIDQPLMQQVLADLALDAEAATALAFRLSASFDGRDETSAAWRRLMTPVTKYWICKMAPAFVYEAMECLGGNGYVEEGPLARLYREAPLNAIWEGSGNVMALDLLRVIQREPGLVDAVLGKLGSAVAGDAALAAHAAGLRDGLAAPGEMEAQGRRLIEGMAVLAAGALLRENAPPAVADAFIATRIAGAARHTYGQGLARADTRAIIERALPQ